MDATPVTPPRTASDLFGLPALVDWERAGHRWTDPSFAAARDGVQRRAEEAIGPDLRPVTESAGWGHAFFCPDHVVPLEFEPARPVDHRCPVDGRRWAGPDVDGGWVTTLNGKIMSGTRAAVIEWRLSGDRSRLDYAKSVVLRYAEIYRDLPPFGRWAGLGRVTGQSLEEAVWAIGIVTVVDQLRDEFTEAELVQLRTGLLEPLAEHMVGQLMHKIHNIECWHLASVATLGVLLGDDDLITTAVDGPTGLGAQFDHGIRPDGWWVEGSPHYHYYMCTALLHTVRVLKDRRPDLTGRDDLRQMLLTPLTLLRPDLSLPAYNDGWHWVSMPNGLGEYLAHYELGHALWDEPVLAGVIAELQGIGVERASEDALLYGPDLAASPVTPLAERKLRDVHPDSGWAVLHDGVADGRFLVAKFGPHGGGHGHVDKLQLDLWAHGERLAPDFGSPNYTSPLQGPWYRQTLSHNTLLVGDESQPRGFGHLLGHQSGDDGIGLADTWVRWPSELPDEPWLSEPKSTDLGAYDGVSLRRTVLWHPDYLIDLCRVTGATAPVALAFHHRGDRVAGPDTTPYELESPDETWQVLTDVARHVTDQPESGPPESGQSRWSTEWLVNEVHTRMWVCDPPGTEVIEARSPGAPPADLSHTVLRRTDAPDPVLVSVLDIWAGDQPHVSAVDCTPSGDGLTITVTCGERTDTWQIVTGGDAPSTVAVDGTTIGCTLAAEPRT